MNTQQVGNVNFIKGITETEDKVIPISQRGVSAVIDTVVEFDKKRTEIETSLKKEYSPKEYIELQQKTADYNIEVSLISALAKKITSAFETLLRS